MAFEGHCSYTPVWAGISVGGDEDFGCFDDANYAFSEVTCGEGFDQIFGYAGVSCADDTAVMAGTCGHDDGDVFVGRAGVGSNFFCKLNAVVRVVKPVRQDDVVF